ncbi:MAG: glycosyltransferase [Candidatus Woykebacteria bacterium]
MSRILFLSMYPLDTLDSAPKVRSYFLHKELDKLEEADLIEGTRLERSWKLLSWVLRGKFFQNKYIYVESSTTVGSPLELIFLLKAKFFGKKVFVFIRDAYPLFPEEFPATTLKQRVLNFGWGISFFVYKLSSTKLVLPNKSFAGIFGLPSEKIAILPSAGEIFNDVKPKSSNILGYVGGASDRYGANLLVEAVEKAREAVPDVRCKIVVRKSEMVSVKKNKVVELIQGNHRKLKSIFADVSIGVLPLATTDYNRITLPLKLFTYMSLGKAVVSTDLPEVVQIVEKDKVGIVCEDSPQSLADAIIFLLTHQKEREMYQRNSLKAIREKYSWVKRAKFLHDLLTNYA